MENDLCAVTVVPEKGADICVFLYKPRAMDILWKSPWGLRRRGAATVFAGGNTEAAWMDQYAGGWQEIFPNGGDECVYRNAALNFHGEASISEWDYSVTRDDPAEVEILATVRLRRSPFELTRRMTVTRGLAGFRIREAIVNRGNEELAYMWGHHPAVGGRFLADGLQLRVPAGRFQHHATEVSPTARIAAGETGNWPVVKDKAGRLLDLSKIPHDGVPLAEFGYLSNLSGGWYGLFSEAHGFGFGLAWPCSVFPYLWLWQERHGSTGYPWYGQCSVMAVEPFSSIPGSGLVAALEAGTAPVLAAGASIESEMAAVFFEADQGELESIQTDGTIRFEKTRRA